MNTAKLATTHERKSCVDKPVEIIQANTEDLDLITRWTTALHQHEDDGELPTHPHFSQNLKKWLELEINNNNTLFLIARIDQEPVGFIAGTSIINDNGLIAAPLKGFIQLLWIDENYRKNNIAQQLLQAIEDCFKSIGIAYIECQYTQKNQLANQFWQAQGYNKTAVVARKVIS
jgi:ribosomal protein S18 acetylase RimI-like enzyme